MNTKRFVASVIFAFIFVFAFNWLWHGMLLMDTYKASPDLWRVMDKTGGMTLHCVAMMLSQLATAFMLAFIFTRNYENKGTAEGIRYGLYIGLLLAAIDLGKFAYMPVDFTLVAAWMLGSLLTGLGTGLVVSLVYRK